jgi:hypothetical protein
VGKFEGDIIHGEHEPSSPDSRPLLQPAISGGIVLPGALPPLDEIRERAMANLAALPDQYKVLEHPPEYPVTFSDHLRALRQRAIELHEDRVHAAESPAGT